MMAIANRARGPVLASLLGMPDNPGQLPPRGSWQMNPSLGDALGSAAGSAVKSLGERTLAAGKMEHVRMPDGSVEGQRTAQTSPATAQTSPATGQGTDYAALLRQALGERPTMSTGQKIASVVGPMLLAAGGNEAAAMQAVGNIGSQQREWDERKRQADLTAITWGREDALAREKREEPRFFSGSSDQVRFDPATGETTTIYDAPQDFDEYAASLGYEPGNEDYFRAVEDYVLRGSGPSAFKYDRDLEIVRAAQRQSLEAARQANRRDLIDYRNDNPAPPRPRASSARQSIVTVSTPAEARKLAPGTKYRGPDGVVRER